MSYEEPLPATSQVSKGASSRTSQKGRLVKIAAWVRHTGWTAVRLLGPSESVAGDLRLMPGVPRRSERHSRRAEAVEQPVEVRGELAPVQTLILLPTLRDVTFGVRCGA